MVTRQTLALVHTNGIYRKSELPPKSLQCPAGSRGGHNPCVLQGNTRHRLERFSRGAKFSAMAELLGPTLYQMPHLPTCPCGITDTRNASKCVPENRGPLS